MREFWEVREGFRTSSLGVAGVSLALDSHFSVCLPPRQAEMAEPVFFRRGHGNVGALIINKN